MQMRDRYCRRSKWIIKMKKDEKENWKILAGWVTIVKKRAHISSGCLTRGREQLNSCSGLSVTQAMGKRDLEPPTQQLCSSEEKQLTNKRAAICRLLPLAWTSQIEPFYDRRPVDRGVSRIFPRQRQMKNECFLHDVLTLHLATEEIAYHSCI